MSCAIPCCPNKRGYASKKSFFRLPSADNEDWLKAVGKSRLTSNLFCEEHFRQEEIISLSKIKRLKSNAKPNHLPEQCSACSKTFQKPSKCTSSSFVIESVCSTLFDFPTSLENADTGKCKTASNASDMEHISDIMDFLKICRACTSEKTNLLNLFAIDCDDEPTLGEKFIACTSLDLQEADFYPQHICYSCAKLLETAYKFRKQCERSFNQLQKKLLSMQKISEKDIKVEPNEDIHNEKVETICVDEDDDNLKHQEILSAEEYVENPPSIASRDEECMVVDPSENSFIITEIKEETTSMTAISQGPEKQLIDVNITIQERPHECNQCGKSFFTTKALELHVTLFHKLKQTDTVKEDAKVSEIHHSNPHFCSICTKQLDSIDELRMHRILKHGAKALKCNFCGKSMRDRIAYRKHLLSHNNSERYDCKICGKQYTDVRYLHRHMLYHQVSVYKCEEPNCEKYFNVKHKCVEHIRLYHNRNLTSDEVRQMMPTDEVQMI